MKKILAVVFLALSSLTAAKASTSCANGGGERIGIEANNGNYYSVCYQGGQAYTDYVQISWFRYNLWYFGDLGL